MKNKLMLIVVTIALLLSLTACGKIEFNPVDYRDYIKHEVLTKLELSSDTQNDLFLMEEDSGWHDFFLFSYTGTYIFVAYIENDIKGYEVEAKYRYDEWGNDGQWIITVGKEVIIHIGTLKDLEKDGDDDV